MKEVMLPGGRDAETGNQNELSLRPETVRFRTLCCMEMNRTEFKKTDLFTY